MPSTNKTLNYNLSQFLGVDKPAWLSDYNVDMDKIDTGIHNAQLTATSADGKADANATAIGTLSDLTTTAKTDLVSAVNEVDTNTDTVAGVASSASQTATAAKTEADGLAAYLTMSVKTALGANNLSSATGTIQGVSGLNYVKNATSSLGKLYGRIDYKPTNPTSWQEITINIDSGVHPTEAYTIFAGVTNCSSATVNQMIEQVYIKMNPNGTIGIRFYAEFNQPYRVILPPALYFFEDFGDVSQ